MAMRRELVTILIEDHAIDPEALLESLVAGLPEQITLETLERISEIEDWNDRYQQAFKEAREIEQ